MRLQPVLFALLLSLGVLGAQSASAQVIINARIGSPYYGPRAGYYGPGYYPPVVAPVIVAPPPVMVYPRPYYYAPRAYYGPRYYGGRGYGRGYGRRW
ncbi:MAG: hypothetical protein ACRYFZ_23500 [Janthinobacterium lividum]